MYTDRLTKAEIECRRLKKKLQLHDKTSETLLERLGRLEEQNNQLAQQLQQISSVPAAADSSSSEAAHQEGDTTDGFDSSSSCTPQEQDSSRPISSTTKQAAAAVIALKTERQKKKRKKRNTKRMAATDSMSKVPTRKTGGDCKLMMDKVGVSGPVPAPPEFRSYLPPHQYNNSVAGLPPITSKQRSKMLLSAYQDVPYPPTTTTAWLPTAGQLKPKPPQKKKPTKPLPVRQYPSYLNHPPPEPPQPQLTKQQQRRQHPLYTPAAAAAKSGATSNSKTDSEEEAVAAAPKRVVQQPKQNAAAAAPQQQSPTTGKPTSVTASQQVDDKSPTATTPTENSLSTFYHRDAVGAAIEDPDYSSDQLFVQKSPSGSGDEQQEADNRKDISAPTTTENDTRKKHSHSSTGPGINVEDDNDEDGEAGDGKHQGAPAGWSTAAPKRPKEGKPFMVSKSKGIPPPQALPRNALGKNKLAESEIVHVVNRLTAQPKQRFKSSHLYLETAPAQPVLTPEQQADLNERLSALRPEYSEEYIREDDQERQDQAIILDDDEEDDLLERLYAAGLEKWKSRGDMGMALEDLSFYRNGIKLSSQQLMKISERLYLNLYPSNRHSDGTHTLRPTSDRESGNESGFETSARSATTFNTTTSSMDSQKQPKSPVKDKTDLPAGNVPSHLQPEQDEPYRGCGVVMPTPL